MTQYDKAGEERKDPEGDEDRDASEELITESPQGDVTYDPRALQEAREGMHAGGHGKRDLDPPGGHDPEALREAAERIAADQS